MIEKAGDRRGDGLSSDRHQRITEVFLRACELPPGERAAFLSQACGGDAALRAEVESLLAHDEKAVRVFGATEAAPGTSERLPRLLARIEQAMRPERVGPYHVLEILGQGAMGVVYKAEQENPRRTVALKVIQPGIASAAALKRFEHEVEVLGRLHYPGIGQIYDAGTFDTGLGPQPYFVMELIQGGSLLDYAIARELTIPERLELFAKVCDAVHYAHQKGVIHRDLKPGNILVDDTGQPKVLDFGIARATDSDIQTTTGRTSFGQLMGTIPYMSPEQAAGDSAELDTRSDVYSLGVILYELLAECLPYPIRDKLVHEALRVIREDEPTPLRSVQRLLGADLETIVAKALAKEKERRYQSSSELAADIRRYLDSEPILARPPATLYQIRKFARRHRAVVVGAGMVFAALLLGFAASTWLYLESRTARALAEENATQRQREKERADAAAAEARATLAQVIQLSDSKQLDDLEQEARRGLFPLAPELLPAIDSWLERAHDLASRLEIHRRTLHELRERSSGRSGTGTSTPEGVEEERQERLLEGLTAGVERLRDPAGRIGTIAEMQRRRVAAANLDLRSVHEPAAAWEGAIDEIALSPQYGELEIVPQRGLVPLEPDPETGLWEFWHVATGERPERDPGSDRWSMTASSGLVLVLVPGGSFAMGAAVRSDEAASSDTPRDPFAGEDERPVHTVVLAPFFVSKYEMTQAQWERLSNGYWEGSEVASVETATSPAVEMAWEEARETLARVDLLLPTEAQWEYSARAGSRTVWWSGDSEASLALVANLADSSLQRRVGGITGDFRFLPWDDGYPSSSPVGRFQANRWGLHDVAGNVWEWCRDGYARYEAPVRGEDGERVVELPHTHIRRGGSFASSSRDARSAARFDAHRDFRHGDLGLRPLCRLR
ncbi:MAG: bifunctional serine/threonine-protein kinase/formylglycine-generating enzyme family protein [Planctomycetota bacterium]